MSAAKHLLRWKGRPSGPFAPDEIRAQLQGSEIGLMHEVQVNGQWITVEKFLALSAPRPPEPAPAPVTLPPSRKAPPPPPIEEPRSPFPRAMPAPPPPLPPAAPPRVPADAGPRSEFAHEPSGAETLVYAGFWLRSVAAVIDGVVVSLIAWAFAAILLVIGGGSLASPPPWLTWLVFLMYAAGSWLYFALMESSESRASLGKLAVGLVVTDLAGRRITFTHASGRYFGKMISCVTVGVGFFMAAFTEHKQALHDLLAGCHVLLRLPPTRHFQP